MIDLEFEEIRRLVGPHAHRRLEAHAKLRALATIEGALGGQRTQPSEADLRKLARDIRKGRSWQDLFPGVASLRLDTSGSGLTISIRITKAEGEAVRLVPEGTPGAAVVAFRKVNETSFYSLALSDLAEKIGLSQPKTLAAIKELRLQESDDCFRVFTFKTQQLKRYSAKALDALKEGVPKLNMEEVWQRHKPSGKAVPRPKP
jgi:cell division protein FtsI/penicillin-binding protein 2